MATPSDVASVPCTICLSASDVVLMDRKLDLYRCAACDHTFTVKPKHAHEVYEEAYFLERHPNWFANPDYGLFERVRAQIKANMPAGRSSLIDVGCGNGAMLRYFRQNEPSWELWGIDEHPNEHPGIRFLKGDLYTTPIAEKFDVVTTLMTIEHLDDVRKFAEKIDGWLKPGGLLVISTNNNGGLLYSAARALKAVGIRVAFDRVYSDHHLNHFTNRSLRTLLARYGLRLLSMKNHNYPLKAVDTPPAGPLVKTLYMGAVATSFVVSDLLGNGFLQTLVCRKDSA